MREDFGVAEGADLEFNLELLPRLLWWGLRHEDADLTVEQIEEMVDGENMHAVVEAMNKAFGSQALLVRRPEDPLKAAASPLPPGAPADSSGRAAT